MIKQVFKTLVAFLAVATMTIGPVRGQSAQSETLLTTVTATGQTSYSQSPDGIVTVTLNNIDSYNPTWGWLESGSVTVEASQGYTITRCVFKQNPNSEPNRVLVDDQAPFTATMWSTEWENYVSAATSTGDVIGADYMNGISTIEVYGYAAAPAVPHTVRFASGNDGWTVTDVDSARSAVAPAVLQNVMAGDSLVVTAPATLPGKVKSVKAVKYVPPIVNPVVGQIIGSDGKNYDADATLPTGVTAVAKICYVGSDNGEAAPYNHGLALALSDASNGCYWKTSHTDAGHTKQTSSTFTEESGLQYNATHNSDDYPAFKAAITYSPAAPTGCSAWFLASGYQWKKMIGAAGLSNLGLKGKACYWSSSEKAANYAWYFYTNGGGQWYDGYKDSDGPVRACLAF